MTRAPIAALAPGERSLDGALGHYLATVLRLRVGDALVGFDPASGKEADAVVVRADRHPAALTVRFGALRDGAVRPDRRITWIQGLAKGDKCETVVRDATELGMTRFVVAATSRSVVRLDAKRGAARRARWARIAQESARQSGRSEAPRVDAPCAWSEALSRGAECVARFCLWEGATEPLGPLLFAALASGASLAFACGPEGGLDEGEVALAAAQGWAIASLGPRALRTETVAAAVLGAVQVWGWGR
ncbi:MAG TPA: RsmE family RNA methyltransferase [Polyangiaceae bacterium]|nr:RsmE family RNA methyltransferase [Polyangiaceae bacterium]